MRPPRAAPGANLGHDPVLAGRRRARSERHRFFFPLRVERREIVRVGVMVFRYKLGLRVRRGRGKRRKPLEHGRVRRVSLVQPLGQRRQDMRRLA
ncbi:hypothetical protein AUC69_09335 [Methyloceanibacter superfactus]|uniref:Uncharacterized protein n=1 Tax=Methyloceanibacter superfactus TaxID=1774969 RepID=A0A1E3W1B3_9HYPH|nr:hypothetical protein AUC69_09335 [Methyloceanibacter superfactus]